MKTQVIESLQSMLAHIEDEFVSSEEVELAIELVRENPSLLDGNDNVGDGVDAALAAAADKLGLGDL